MLLRGILAVVMAIGLCGSAQATPKAWTFLVYLNGDNSLDSFGDTNLDQMKAVGSTKDVNIVVLRDRSDQSVSAKIYYVNKGSLKVVKDYGKNIDMGDWNTLVDLFKYAKEQYPANHYVVDVWDHGGGWGKKYAPIFRDISWDDGTGHFITTPQLGQAMAAIKVLNGGKNIDVLGTDACLMQMGEVAHEVSASVDVFAASEETEPGAGWDYTTPLAFLTKTPTASALDVAKEIEKAYVELSGYNSQGSAVSTAELTLALPVIGEFADALAKFDGLSKDEVQQAISNTKSFAMTDFRDLIDFASKVEQATKSAALKAKAAAVKLAMKKVIYASFENGMEGANGLSVWLPDSWTYTEKKDKYAQLAWSASRWPNFLAKLYQ